MLPGLLLRGYASGYVKKNQELTITGPYAFTRNPLYLGSMLMAAGFAVALMSWLVAVVLAIGFALIYIPVIAGEERFLRAQFPGFAAYCRAVPRLISSLPTACRSSVKSRQRVTPRCVGSREPQCPWYSAGARRPMGRVFRPQPANAVV